MQIRLFVVSEIHRSCFVYAYMEFRNTHRQAVANHIINNKNNIKLQ